MINTGPLLENIFRNNKPELLKLGVREKIIICTFDKLKRYMECPHCGTILQKSGFGTHQASIGCFALRNSHLAQLEGYVRCDCVVPYMNYTSPFIKRFMTRTTGENSKNKGRRQRRNLGLETWVEKWFYDLWNNYTECCYESVEEAPVAGAIQQVVAQVTSVKYSRKIKIKDGYEDIFAGLAKAKRAGSKKQIDAVLGILDIRLSAEKD